MTRAKIGKKTRRLLETRFVQIDGVAANKVGDDIFLVSEELGTIHHLDQMGAAIWCQLALPVTGNDIVLLLAAAFPAAKKSDIETDVSRLLKDFVYSEVIRPV